MTSAFTPITGTIGGSLIGLSASILLLGNGDILGASGIVSSFLKNPIKAALDPHSQWKVSFLSSFLITSMVYTHYIHPLDAASTPLLLLLPSREYALGGLLVGLGTKISNGCTSGHGICGLARRSLRSLVAVATFMTTGVLTGSLISSRYHSFIPILSSITITSSRIGTCLVIGVSTLCLPMFLYKPKSTQQQQAQQETHTKEDIKHYPNKTLVSILSGSIFALGLAISGMVQNSKVLGFLNISHLLSHGTWDGTLMTVMGSGLLLSMLGYQFIPNHGFLFPKTLTLKRPLFAKECDGFTSIPTNRVIDRPLIVGSALFGIGWGLAGVCPGPAIYLAAIGVSPILTYWWPSYYIGATFGDFIKKYL